jgi:hypothetical protein
VNARPTDSVYNDYPVFKTTAEVPVPAASHKLSPRAKAGIGAGAVILAATGMVTWSQYETAQANAQVKTAQLSLEQTQLNLQLAQQQNQAAKTSGQETPAQKARREALQQCITAAGNSYNGVADCASAYPAVGAGGELNTAQSVASSTPASSGGSGTGLVVLGAVGAVVLVGVMKKRLSRSY